MGGGHRHNALEDWTVKVNFRLAPACAYVALVSAALAIGACGDAEDGENIAKSTTTTSSASTQSMTPAPRPSSSKASAVQEVVPKYISSPCDFLPVAPITAIGIEVGDLDASTVVASRDKESAEALQPSGKTALSLCDGGGISVAYRVYPTPEQALADCAANVRSNEELSGAQSSPVPEIPGAMVVMAEDGGSGGVQWVSGNVSVSLVANYDQDEISVDTVRSTLMTAAEKVNSQM
ncbi:hypothetical protein [Williamsia soli]|uniref:hypothetical protein n=1 Tax=Williamsia soli TaxID=364929 RepID=UPI001A9FFDAB|nr:hypothetical protein [Williamsia soli]